MLTQSPAKTPAQTVLNALEECKIEGISLITTPHARNVYQAVHQFMEGEYSVENIDFLYRMRELAIQYPRPLDAKPQESQEYQEYQQAMEDVYTHFIEGTEKQQQINLSAEIKNSLAAKKGSRWNIADFIPAIRNIQTLIMSDSFTRAVNNSAVKDAVQVCVSMEKQYETQLKRIYSIAKAIAKNDPKLRTYAQGLIDSTLLDISEILTQKQAGYQALIDQKFKALTQSLALMDRISEINKKYPNQNAFADFYKNAVKLCQEHGNDPKRLATELFRNLVSVQRSLQGQYNQQPLMKELQSCANDKFFTDLTQQPRGQLLSRIKTMLHLHSKSQTNMTPNKEEASVGHNSARFRRGGG